MFIYYFGYLELYSLGIRWYHAVGDMQLHLQVYGDAAAQQVSYWKILEVWETSSDEVENIQHPKLDDRR